MDPATSSASPLTRREREDLAALVRRRERVAKTATEQRAAELLADVEAQLAATFFYDDDAIWKQARDAAQQAVADADTAIAARCRELGIPEKFRPGLGVSWYGRGENAAKERRAELRGVARTRIAALAKEARAAIERRSVEAQTSLLAGSILSDQARAYLDMIPSVESLMPALELPALGPLRPQSPTRALSDDAT